ncbi:unnamed protein product [Caenorhabditis nigoni]
MLKIASLIYSKLNKNIISIEKNFYFLTKVGHRLDHTGWVRTKCTFFILKVPQLSWYIISMHKNWFEFFCTALFSILTENVS